MESFGRSRPVRPAPAQARGFPRYGGLTLHSKVLSLLFDAKVQTRLPNAALNERVIESIEYIRTKAARSAPFPAVPGWGGSAMGAVAIVAAVVAAPLNASLSVNELKAITETTDGNRRRRRSELS
jgi:hypothetical protein